MTNPYGPNEPAAAIWYERADMAGVDIGGIAYGVHISVFFMCAYHLLKKRTGRYKFWLLFIFVLFGLGTVNVAFDMHFSQSTWIDDRNFPGGPFAWSTRRPRRPLLTGGNAESILISFLADGLLIYRCHVLYDTWWLLVIPILALFASLACGILLTIQTSHPGPGLFGSDAINFGLPYFALSMGLNMLLTIILISRLLYMRYRINKTLGSEYTRLYTTIAVMLFESALPYGLISLVFLILYGSGNIAASLFLPLLVQVECISPMVIILRVTRGKAWSKETISPDELTTLRFRVQHNPAMASSTMHADQTSGEGSVIMFKPGEPTKGRHRAGEKASTVEGLEEV